MDMAIATQQQNKIYGKIFILNRLDIVSKGFSKRTNKQIKWTSERDSSQKEEIEGSSISHVCMDNDKTMNDEQRVMALDFLYQTKKKINKLHIFAAAINKCSIRCFCCCCFLFLASFFVLFWMCSRFANNSLFNVML